MLKRFSLTLMLLVALVGVAGVRAQDGEPQTMAAYLPADAEFAAFARIDGDYLDTLSDVVNTVVAKFPAELTAQIPTVNLQQMLEMQVGQLEDTGIGDYVAVSISNMAVTMDREVSNDDEVRAYIVVQVADRAALEDFLSERGNLEGEADGDWTRYPIDRTTNLFVGNQVAYITNAEQMQLDGLPLSDDGPFSETIAQLPETNYNILVYADLGPLFAASMEMMPAESMEVFETMGMDLSEFGPIAFGATILDGRSLVIDSYVSPFPMMAAMGISGQIDPAFAANIPAEFSFVIHGTNLQAAFDAALDSFEQTMEMTDPQQALSREQIDGFFQGFFGISLEEDVIAWMTGDYALVADFDMMALISDFEAGTLDEFTLDPRFAFVVEGDGSDRPQRWRRRSARPSSVSLSSRWARTCRMCA